MALVEAQKDTDLPKYSLSHYVSTPTRILFTVLILCTMALLILSNTNQAEYVNVLIKPSRITITDRHQHNNISVSTLMQNYLSKDFNDLLYTSNTFIKDKYETKVFIITIPSSIKDFWISEAYELAIVVAAASLIWPYVKLIILLTVWLIPLSQNLRTKIILFIDQAGKWSYIDLYASVVMTVCLYVHISYTFKHFNLDIRIVCEPDVGIVTFVIANLLSMAYSHIFIFLDQKYGYKHHVEIWMQSKPIILHDSSIIHSITSIEHIDLDQRSSASSNKINETPVLAAKVSGAYKSFYRTDIDLWRMDKSYNIFAMLYRPQSIFGAVCFSIYLVCLWGILWLIVENAYTVPVRFDIEGIVGVVLGSPANIRLKTPIQTADQLVSTTDKYNNAVFLSACYWITVIIAPVLTQIVLILIWFCPIKHKYFVILLKSVWFVQAWNALDVFFVGYMSGAIEMNTVSKWIIDSKYPGLCGDDGIVTNIVGMGCFNVMGHVTKGLWIALAAAISQWFVIWFSLFTAKDIGIHGMEY